MRKWTTTQTKRPRLRPSKRRLPRKRLRDSLRHSPDPRKCLRDSPRLSPDPRKRLRDSLRHNPDPRKRLRDSLRHNPDLRKRLRDSPRHNPDPLNPVLHRHLRVTLLRERLTAAITDGGTK